MLIQKNYFKIISLFPSSFQVNLLFSLSHALLSLPLFFPNPSSFHCYSRFTAFPGSLAAYPALLISAPSFYFCTFKGITDSSTPLRSVLLEIFLVSGLPDFCCIFCNMECAVYLQRAKCKHNMQDLVIDILAKQRENKVILATQMKKRGSTAD